MADDFSRCVELLDELQESWTSAVAVPALSDAERLLLRSRLIDMYERVTEAQVKAAVAVQERGLQIASGWFG